MITKHSFLMLSLLLVTAAAAAQPTVSASGQFLSVDGVVAQNGAILKIVGPGGFGHMQTISRGESVTVDLLAGLRARGGAATSLHTGTYHYELVSRPTGNRVRGSFQIGGVSARDTQDSAPDDDIGGQRPDEPLALDETDRIQIADDVNDGITVLDMDSDGATSDLHWGLVNEEGILTLREHNTNITNDQGTVNVSFMRGGGDGGVGIGTDLTLFPLDIQGPGAIINLFDTDGGTNWKLINSGGDFILNKDCEFSCDIFERWDVVIVEDGSLENSLVIDSGGVAMSSSRTVKKNIEPAASTALLDELAQLPIYTWSYAADGTDTMHVGPMAEDFHQRFGFGNDEKMLSPMDTGGLALAAIQGLRQEVLDKDRKLEAMERRLEELERLIASSR